MFNYLPILKILRCLRMPKEKILLVWLYKCCNPIYFQYHSQRKLEVWDWANNDMASYCGRSCYNLCCSFSYENSCASSINKNCLPLGPSSLPLIGNFHILLDSKRPIHQILASLAKIYGLVTHVKFGSCPILIISSTNLARECFIVNDKALGSKPKLSQGKNLG